MLILKSELFCYQCQLLFIFNPLNPPQQTHISQKIPNKKIIPHLTRWISKYIQIAISDMANIHKSQPPLLSLILVLVLLSPFNCLQHPRITMNSPWQVKINKCVSPNFKDMVMNTTVPTVLHLDLLRNGKIADPYFGDNYKDLEWVSSCNVTYSHNFTLQDTQDRVEIVFEGIDTYGVIKLNGHILTETNNAFIEYRIKLDKTMLKSIGGINELEVEIFSTKMYDEEANRKNHMPFVYAHTRKAAYQYSWDWAPYLNTMGIWKPVYIQFVKQIKIDYVWVRNRKVSDQVAILNFAVALDLDPKIFKDGKVTDNFYEIQIFHNNRVIMTETVTSKHVYADVEIKKPKLWWPNGIGKPNMYNFVLKLVNKQIFQEMDQRTIPYGIRTVQLEVSDKKFTFIINGHPIYCKGANYVPTDMFYPRTSNPDYQPGTTQQKLLNDAVQSKFNMIRVWGGGQYQSQEFLELASRKGIMLFYDFMFSDSIYPSSYDFLANVENQITYNVRKARNYPCVMLWSGNNQIYQGILSWGWGSPNYKDDYKRIFEETIPAILRKEHPDVPYIPSSPIYGVGNSGFEKGGDIHYWGVWAGASNFESYKNAIGHFNSEFGTQSIPVWETVLNFTSQENRKFESPQFAAHERHNSGFNTLIKYLRIYGHNSRNFEMEVYLSGLVQAYGVEIAIKHQRISKPKSYGTLYWQFNDAWPAISWSSVDYFGRWKPLQYMAKRIYPDVAVFCIDGKIVAVNDNIHLVQAIIFVTVQHFNGTSLFTKTQQVTLNQNEVQNIFDIPRQKYEIHMKDVVVYSEIVAGRHKEMSSTFFFRTFKDLNLDPSAKLYIQIRQHDQSLILRTDKFIKNLYISSKNGQYLKFSDNYFDMITGRKYVINLKSRQDQAGNQIAGKMTKQQFLTNLLYRSYIQIHSDSSLDLVFSE